jgi:ABC-type polysaccharide/polyol phosphate export permease
VTTVPEAARIDAPGARRRRKWIAAFSLPGFVALVAFALMAWLHVGSSEWWLLVTVPVGVAGVFSWGFAPFLAVIGIVLFFRDPWRRQRSRHERVWLRLLVFGSPVAWFLSNLINDAYHLLR